MNSTDVLFIYFLDAVTSTKELEEQPIDVRPRRPTIFSDNDRSFLEVLFFFLYLFAAGSEFYTNTITVRTKVEHHLTVGCERCFAQLCAFNTASNEFMYLQQ